MTSNSVSIIRIHLLNLIEFKPSTLPTTFGILLGKIGNTEKNPLIEKIAKKGT